MQRRNFFQNLGPVLEESQLVITQAIGLGFGIGRVRIASLLLGAFALNSHGTITA